MQVSLKFDKKTGTLHEHVCTFMTVSRSVLLRMRNVSSKMCGEKKTHFIFRNCSPKIVLFKGICGNLYHQWGNPRIQHRSLLNAPLTMARHVKPYSNIRLEEMGKPITHGLQQSIPRECLKNTKQGHFMRCDTSIVIQTSCFFVPCNVNQQKRTLFILMF